jgi:hypothetical protein
MNLPDSFLDVGQAGYSMPPAALETSHDASVNLNCVEVLYVS